MLEPKIKRNYTFTIKKCSRCGGSFGPENFAPSRSIFCKDGYLPICNTCLNSYLKENDFSWRAIDKICQYADIPFIPKEWERLREMTNEDDLFATYANVFQGKEYEGLGWDTYYEQFKSLRNVGLIEDELPKLRDEKFKKLREKWGGNYADEDLVYLEGLYSGLLATQNVNGALQVDQAQKICKISFEIDSRIREGADFDKLLTSYDKLVKTAEFTPKNVKNATDFDSVGELFRWLEKRGWKNKFYDNVTRDIVDETMKNIQNFTQRLYTNETGISEEIDRRVSALQSAKELEDYYDTNKEYDLDEYDNAGYEELIKSEDFNPNLGDENETTN
nr:MAG TPA: Transcription initiation factor IIE, alpha FINGER, Transcription [Caudoviricetes sp.]